METEFEPEEGPKLSHRAEVFRSKLIEEFQILEGTSEQGRTKVPVYSTTEIIGTTKVAIIWGIWAAFDSTLLHLLTYSYTKQWEDFASYKLYICLCLCRPRLNGESFK